MRLAWESFCSAMTMVLPISSAGNSWHQMTRVTRASLKQAVQDLFTRQAEVAVFFFAGHGTVNNLGGYLVTQDAKHYDEGLSMIDVLTLANNSLALERIIILDCCHSGALGNWPAINNDAAMITEGVTMRPDP